jgi:gamma-glutamyltranspeptidase/glutathione hydrolase
VGAHDDKPRRNGLVVASHQAAADAGAVALTKGGTAVDAAVATAFALSVVDPASCGIGGYGGFLVYSARPEPPVRVDFNTWAPRRLDHSVVHIPGAIVHPLDGGVSVAPPAVVAGLLAAHARFGRVPLADLLLPALRLARNGFAIGRDLTRALSNHWERTKGGHQTFASVFFPSGHAPERGSWLVQPELAQTLESIARDGVDTFLNGPVVDAACAVSQSDGGVLEPDDFRDDMVAIAAAEEGGFESATVYGPSRDTSGAGVVFSALSHVDSDALGPNRGRAYVDELVQALTSAWGERAELARAALTSQHTTHLCAADSEGGLASLTFTHGHRRFGSGLIGPGTGVVLNSGINLFAATPSGPQAVTNMTPLIIEDEAGDRHAVGSVGGPRIPGIVLSSVVDLVHYGFSIADAIAAPHLCVRPDDGTLEAEPDLLARLGDDDTETSPILAGVGFGTTCGITCASDRTMPGADHRFEGGVAWT